MTELYKIAPVSATVFAIQQNPVDKPTEIDLNKLNEAGLHKVLWIFRKKLDDFELRGAAHIAWDALPMSKQRTFDPELAARVPMKTLHELLKKFLETWFIESREQRYLTEVINPNKFPKGWDPLHTVKIHTPPTSTQTTISAQGTTVDMDPQKTFQQLQKELDELAALVRTCSLKTSEQERADCYSGLVTKVQQV